MNGFSAHVALLRLFLDRRLEIVEKLESTLLNVQGKDISRSRDRKLVEQRFDACFFGLPALPRDLVRLNGQLAARHLADGFEPVRVGRFSPDLDPLEIVGRGYAHWHRHRWPGKAGRLTCAQTLYSVFILRLLESLSLCIWDDGDDRAGDRLQDVQRLLDELNVSQGPAFVRDARWLMQTAQGPLTRHLEPYFAIAERIAASFTASDRLAIHRAGAVLAGGHLRSQLRYATWKDNRPPDDPDVLAFTRNSNSMDNALLIRDLVPMLEAYQTARGTGDNERRVDLADAILQALSADPELLLVRLDLLVPWSMIETLFIDRGDDGRLRYTPLGEGQRRLLDRYGALIGELAGPLLEDAVAFDPARHVYSPFGIVYGFCADLMSNMAMTTMVAPAQPLSGLALEDLFSSRGRLDIKLEQSRTWEALPRRDGERKHFDHSVEWAGTMFARLMAALRARVMRPAAPNASAHPDRTLFVVRESVAVESLRAGTLPSDVVRAQEYCSTSDLKRASSGAAAACPRSRMLDDRNEARFLASAEIDGAWFGISKILLTALTGQGQHALVTDVPPPVVDALKLTWPAAVVLP